MSFRRTDAGHQQTELFSIRLVRAHDIYDPAFVHHGDAVGQREDLVKLGRNQQNRGTRVALGDDVAVNEFDRREVDAARRLLGDQQIEWT